MRCYISPATGKVDCDYHLSYIPLSQCQKCPYFRGVEEKSELGETLKWVNCDAPDKPALANLQELAEYIRRGNRPREWQGHSIIYLNNLDEFDDKIWEVGSTRLPDGRQATKFYFATKKGGRTIEAKAPLLVVGNGVLFIYKVRKVEPPQERRVVETFKKPRVEPVHTTTSGKAVVGRRLPRKCLIANFDGSVPTSGLRIWLIDRPGMYLAASTWFYKGTGIFIKVVR